MGIFRNKNKLQLVSLRAYATRAVYQNNDFPTIDLTFVVKDADDKKRSDLTEVTVSMTLWEANEVCRDLLRIVTNTSRLSRPQAAIAIPWGEGGNI